MFFLNLSFLKRFFFKLSIAFFSYIFYPSFGISPKVDLTEEKTDKDHIILTLRPKDPSELSDLEIFHLKDKILEISNKNNIICMTSIFGKSQDNKDISTTLKSNRILTSSNIDEYNKDLTTSIFSFKDHYDIKYIYFITIRIKIIKI